MARDRTINGRSRVRNRQQGKIKHVGGDLRPKGKSQQQDAGPLSGLEPVPATAAALPPIPAPEPRKVLTHSLPVRVAGEKRGGDARELAERGSFELVERPAKRLRRSGVFYAAAVVVVVAYSPPGGSEGAAAVEGARDIFVAYPKLHIYLPTLAEAFALDKAFTLELGRGEFSRIVYENGRFYVKHEAYHAGGRQYFPQQLHESLTRMELVTQDIAHGQTIIQNSDNETVDITNYWAEDSDDEEDDESDAEIARDRIFALLKEVQYVYAEEIVKVARANNITHKPTEKEVNTARHAHELYYKEASIERILPLCPKANAQDRPRTGGKFCKVRPAGMS